jgi:HD-like signal output (HDOD) protein
MNALNSLIIKGQCVRLPSLPVVGLKILEMLKDDDFSVDELSAIILTDPALSARILKMANSALYSHIPHVDSIERAVTLLGARTLKNMALSFVVIGELQGDDPRGFDYEYFWKKSVTAAVAAEMLSHAVNKRSDDIYVSALLMNIGKVIMYICEPDDYTEVLDEKRITGAAIGELEKRVFGFDHQNVGGDILKQWNIPESVYIPISFHHDIDKCPSEYFKSAEILETASAVSSLYSVDKSIDRFASLYDMLKDRFGFDKERVNEFVDDVAVKTVEILSIYDIEPGDMKPYSELIEQANRELGKLSISYEYLVFELKESKIKSEKLARELMESISRIKTLTGLLPICATCKQIRDDHGNWHQVESYIEWHTEAKFTHGICPECKEKMIDNLDSII